MVYVDTGGWVGLYSKRDQYHLEARRIWAGLTTGRPRLFTSSLVINEVVTLLARSTSYASAVDVGKRLLAAEGLTILRHGLEDDHLALDLMNKWADQSVGYTDCVSFALMRRHRIHSAFAFDRHFQLAGFQLLE